MVENGHYKWNHNYFWCIRQETVDHVNIYQMTLWSVQVVGFGEKEKETHGDDQSCSASETQDAETKTSSYGNVSKLIFLPASPVLAKAIMITDIRTFTSSLSLHPYHKILQ